ncbi:MAG: hypothetical protein Q4D73_04895 [Actinomycetaceae bacterium]|nr:hypothetical protein [Actinomycetaceae bacterium]
MNTQYTPQIAEISKKYPLIRRIHSPYYYGEINFYKQTSRTENPQAPNLQPGSKPAATEIEQPFKITSLANRMD